MLWCDQDLRVTVQSVLRTGVLLIWCAVLAAAAPQVARIIQLAAAAVTAASRWLTDSDYPSPTGCVSNRRCLVGHRQRTTGCSRGTSGFAKNGRPSLLGKNYMALAAKCQADYLGVTSGKRGRIERPAPCRVWCGATLDCQLRFYLFDTGRLT